MEVDLVQVPKLQNQLDLIKGETGRGREERG